MAHLSQGNQSAVGIVRYSNTTVRAEVCMISCLIAPKGSFGYSQVSGTSHLTGVVVHSLNDLILCTGQQTIYNHAQAERTFSSFPARPQSQYCSCCIPSRPSFPSSWLVNFLGLWTARGTCFFHPNNLSVNISTWLLLSSSTQSQIAT